MSRPVDRDQFLQMLQPVHDRLARYALVITKNKEDAEDLVNDTLLAAFEQIGTIREPDKFLHLLLSIASRIWKRKRYRAKRFERLLDSHTQSAATQAEGEAQAELRFVLDALDMLSPKLKEAILLFDILDLSHEEIRIIQGGTLSGVKSRIRRGHEQLIRLLGLSEPARQPQGKHAITISALIASGYAE